jgi:hypothetical protein
MAGFSQRLRGFAVIPATLGLLLWFSTGTASATTTTTTS